MLHFIKGDLTEAPQTFICHQVNCQGRMGSGVAKAIRQKWPQVYNEYIDACGNPSTRSYNPLSWTSNTWINDEHTRGVINFFTQEDYGYDGKRYTNYEAFMKACENLVWKIENSNAPFKDKEVSFAFPYKIGCGLGGGDWQIIKRMIEITLGKKWEVYFYYIDDSIFEER